MFMKACLVVVLIANSLTVLAAHPDFSGVWYYGSATPFERPEHLGEQVVYGEAAATAVEQRLVQKDLANRSSDPDRPSPPQGAVIGQEADHNFAPDRVTLTRIDGQARTSLITSPANGRLPLRPNGQDYFDRWRTKSMGEFDNPEMRPTSERCLGNIGPMAPMIGWFYNANARIVQTAQFIVISGEMMPPRIIRLDPAYKPQGFTRWDGESVAAWNSDTLVVRTNNFRSEVSWFFFRSSHQLEVTERFRLGSDNEILYTYTVVDPEIYTAPVVVEMVLSRLPPEKRIYEFACHEGNHSFPVILRGARVQEALNESTRERE